MAIVRSREEHIIIKGIGKVTKVRHKHHQESVLILTSQLRQPPAATCLQPVSSGYWKDGCWEFATRLILLKVIYAPVLYNYSCVFKFVWFFLHWVFKLFVHQRAPLSRNYTKHFTQKQLLYFIRETSLLNFLILKNRVIFIHKNVNITCKHVQHFHCQCLHAHVYRTKSINEPLMRTLVLNMSPTHWKTNYSLAS